MEMLNVTVNGIAVSVPKGATILEAARVAGVEIPTLCYMKEKNEIGACRICVVEATGARGLVTACVYPVTEGMAIQTNTQKVRDARKTTLELILSTHDMNCLSCPRSTNCELQKLCLEYGVDSHAFEGFKPTYELDYSTPHLVRDNNKCILCRRCVAVCNEQYVSVIGANNRGIDTCIGQPFNLSLNDTPCISCGQCTAVCPTAALTERDDTDKVWAALADPTKHVVVQTAPSIRATLGECFDMPIGTNVEGKMVAALRRLGFEKVFDTNTAADFTIVEEATELLDRVNNGGTLPMITSCSPGWVKFCELYYPEMTSHLSTCKSPQQMGGALIKTYWADKMGYDPKDIFVVSIMPCTAKKFEVQREDMSAAEGCVDVDVALTTRELARMIGRAGIKFTSLPDEEFDCPLGVDTGAAVIFGATGGVMEAALRTANDVLTGKDNSEIEFHEVRGTEGLKEATYNIAGMDIKVCVASGAANAKTVMEKIASGEADWTFVEIMGCPGGCVNGGGQPIQPQHVRDTVDLKAVRAKALYDQDTRMEMRKSHLNPVIKEVYDNYFKGGYGCHAAHHALHTSYKGRKKYNF